MITVRRMEEKDIDVMADVALEFFLESDQKTLTLRRDKYEAMLYDYMANEYVRSFLAIDEETQNVAGFIHIYCQDDYTDELIGEMYQFYVRAPYRGTHAGRALVAAANQQYEKWGCARAYCEVGHGGNGKNLNDKLFVNLWSKFGYHYKGTVLMKEISHGRQDT